MGRTRELANAHAVIVWGGWTDDLKEIVVEKAAETGNYDEFLACLPADEPRYAVYDFDYEKPGEGQRFKITFYSW